MLAALRPLGAFGLGDPLVSCISNVIQNQEGYNPAFAPNNNPGNLIYVGPNQDGQTGVTKGAGGFAQFSSPASGAAALNWQIQNYIDRGYSPTQFINTYAPAGTSNAAGGQQTQQMTSNYLTALTSGCGVDPNTPLQEIQGTYAGSDVTVPVDSNNPIDPGLSFPSTPLQSISDTVSSIDWTDPTTIGITVAAAAVLLYALA